MDDAFSRLFSLTSYLAHRFIQFIEDLVHRNFITYPQHFVGPSCSQRQRSTSDDPYDPKIYSFSSQHDYPCTSHADDEKRTFHHKDEIPIYSGSEIVKNSDGGINFIFKGLLLPVLGLKFAESLALASWRCSFHYVSLVQARVWSFLCRVSKTLLGSSGDIGWLQHAPGSAPVKDGSARFRELLQRVRNGEHRLPDCFVYLLIPGLFSNHGPLYFVSTKKVFSKMGLACHIAKIHSEASVEHNAWELKQYIEELYWGSGKRVMLLGHSKGGVDAAAALSVYWLDLQGKVAGLALVQSPYGGTPIASDILREGQVADKETRRVMEFIICKLIKGDIRALEDLTYEKRREFIKRHKLSDRIPLISFHSEADIGPGVISTMTQIAQAELPWLRLPWFNTKEPADALRAGCQVPVIVPVSAAMAICALHLKLRYGEKSDGLVTCRDAEVPGSVVVRPDMKLDHAWMVYASRKKDIAEPDASDMCEALLTMLVEPGRQRK